MSGSESITQIAIYHFYLQAIEEVPRLNCNSDAAWTHGSSLINYMKFGDFIGLSGKIAFDTYGRRTNFYLDVLELQATGLEPIGTHANVDYNIWYSHKRKLINLFLQVL